MIQTITVTSKDKNQDLLGIRIAGEAIKEGVSYVRTTRVYRLEGIDTKKARVLAEKLFCEKINQYYSLNSPIIKGSSSRVEISYKPGVMNPEVASIMKAANDLGIKILAADSSTEYHFFGGNKNGSGKILAEKLKLFNPIVESLVDRRPKTLRIIGKAGPTSLISIRNMDDNSLQELSRDKLFLNLEEMKVIQKYFSKIKRDPTDCELETIAQTWSEHCAHKTFKANLIVSGQRKSPLISRLKKEALKHKKLIVSAFVDNSGVMDFYDGWAICGKVETHNSPSAIEPYGGAATGSGGVFRDVLGTGQGAKTICSTDMFCFANPSFLKNKLPPGCLAPDYLLKRVVTGVKDYGNRMGIPTNNGSVHFHDDFRAKPTVIVGAYGIIPKKKAIKGKASVGDVVVVVGGRTGRDGIHGATFSSAEMTDRTITVNSSAVQIGNAIEQKRMFDAIIEARNLDLIRAIQDCGAGGFSSAIGEMGEEIGVSVDLLQAPLKYQGLSPWEIWVSESQERMALAIPKNKLTAFMKVCKKYNVEATIVGKFDGSRKIRVYYGKRLVCSLSTDFLYRGLPQRLMKTTKPKVSLIKEAKQIRTKNQREWVDIFKKVLASGNVCSKEPIVRLYDHSVQGTNVLQPYAGEFLDGPMDAAIMRPLLSKDYGMIISHGLNPVLNNKNPYWGSIWASVEALSNYVAVGGDFREASLINNYIWPFPDEESLWSLDQSVDAVVDVMKRFKIPVISGKDSLSSTYRGDGKVIKIPPVLCMSVFGRIKDVSKTSSSDFKKTGSVICLVGKQDIDGMGGSTLHEVLKKLDGDVPRCDLKLLPHVFNAIHKGIKAKKILSCHDVSEGGLAVAIFEMCVGANFGADINIPKSDKALNFLFNETVGCFVIELENRATAKKLFKKLPFKILGSTIEDNKISISQNGKPLFQENIEKLKKAWKEPMRKIFA